LISDRDNPEKVGIVGIYQGLGYHDSLTGLAGHIHSIHRTEWSKSVLPSQRIPKLQVQMGVRNLVVTVGSSLQSKSVHFLTAYKHNQAEK